MILEGFNAACPDSAPLRWEHDPVSEEVVMRVPGYRNVTLVAEGGLGNVYRAVSVATGVTWAIKVLRDVADESVAWKRIRRELEALVALGGHRAVIQLVDMIETEHGPALVMEYAAQGSVADRATRFGGMLPLGEVVAIASHAVEALQAVHAAGIVHRDVKPHNLLVDDHGQVKLCDFGISALQRTPEFRQQTHAISTDFASPEELDVQDVGPAADVYSLGATLLNLSRGVRLRVSDRQQPWSPPTESSGWQARLDTVIASCLQPDPQRRPSTEQLAALIDEIAVGMPGSLSRLDIAVRHNNDPRRTSATIVPDVTLQRAQPGAELADPVAARATFEPQAPETPRPARRSSAPAWLSAAAVCLVFSLVAGWWLYGRQANQVRSENAVSLVARPDGLTDVADIDFPLGDVGECLVQQDDSLQVVECAMPHDLQRIGAGQLDSQVAPTSDISRQVRRLCEQHFAEAVGVVAANSEFDLLTSTPTQVALAVGDRTYQCLVGVPGERLVGDVRGTRQ